jgi:isochorismate synthase
MHRTDIPGSIRERRGDTATTAILSHIVDVAAPADLIGFVDAARRRGAPALYWEKRADELAIAGIGSAWRATGSGRARFDATSAAIARLRGQVTIESSSDWLDGPILLGGFSFAEEIGASEAWRGFDPASMTLPEICVVRRGNRAALIRNVRIDPATDTDSLALELARATLPPSIDGTVAMTRSALVREPAPRPASWIESVDAAVDSIRGGAFEKLVLARSCHVAGASRFDLAAVLRRLSAVEAGCTIFSFSADDADFVGATPETLVSLDGGHLQTYALAGTSPRGSTSDRDQHLRQALAASCKDRSEHDIVVRGLLDDLAPLTHSLEVAPEPQIVTLKRVQHLRTSLRGRIAPHRHILDVVAALHPSPAVGGYPKDVAVEEILRREKLERGWYASPIGWTSLDGDGEFAVGLRSGVIRDREAWLFAGAGIVRHSDARAEFLETEIKLKPMLAALGQSE